MTVYKPSFGTAANFNLSHKIQQKPNGLIETFLDGRTVYDGDHLTGNGILKGKISNELAVIGGAVVRLYSERNRVLVRETSTDVNGNFIFESLNPGELFFIAVLDMTSDKEKVILSRLRPSTYNAVNGNRGNSYPFISVETSGESSISSVSYIDRFLSASGTPVFAFDFQNNLLDSSGFSRNATAVGSGNMFIPTNPYSSSNFSLRLTGSGGATIPTSGSVLGNNPRSFVLVCRPYAASFVADSTLAYMGGGDTGGPGAFYAFGVGFQNSTTVPRLRLDWTRDVNDYTLPLWVLNNWSVIVVTHTAGDQRVYIGQVGSPKSLLGTANRNLNTTFSGSGNGNYLGYWNLGRRFVGDIAFMGMKTGVMSDYEIDTFYT